MSVAAYRFTPAARLALVEAEQTARLFSDRRVGPDHLLIALVEQNEGPAFDFLWGRLGPLMKLLPLQVYRAVVADRGVVATMGLFLPAPRTMPRTAALERVLELARDQIPIWPRTVDTDHLLVGILLAGDSAAARAMTEQGIDAEMVRKFAVKRSVSSLFAGFTGAEAMVRKARAAAAAAAADRKVLPVRDESTAILIGTARYSDEGIHDLPTVAANLDDLRDALTDPEFGVFDPDRVICFPDPTTADLRCIVKAAEEPLDTLLIYYAGHGFAEGELYLGLRDTDAAYTEFTAMSYDTIRRMVLRAGSRRNLIVLDCCYAGTAVEFMAAGDPGGVVDVRGAAVLTATSRSEQAHAPAGERTTSFTGALLKVLRDGVEGGGPLITVQDLTREMTRVLRSAGRPQPRLRATDSIADLALRPNRAWAGR